MGRPYYYFAASLPMIEWEGKLPMTVEDFLSETRRLLTDEDSDLIRRLLQDDDTVETANEAARLWVRFNRNFRNEMAWFRAQRANKDPLKSVRGTKEDEPSLRDIVRGASKMPDLLEAEKLLDRTCWQFLSDLAAGHYFDLEYVIVYGLKLKILERHQVYHSPEGKAVFNDIQTAELPAGCIVSSDK